MSVGYNTKIENISSKITYDGLRKELERYKNILSSDILDYFDNLIKLDISILSHSSFINASAEERELLNQLDIYYKIKLYNLYYFTKKILDDNNIKYETNGNIGSLNMASFRLDEVGHHNIIFDYWFRDNKKKSYFDEDDNSVSFYVTKDGEEQRQLEMDRVMSKLEELYDAKCPYSSHSNLYGGPDSTWHHDREQKIRKYEDLFKKLDEKKELSLEDKDEIEITSKMYNLLIEGHSIDLDDFIDINEFNIDMPRRVKIKEDTNLSKVLVKKTPDALIKNNIRYL